MIKVLNVLCEGKSEEMFAAKVLRPYLQPYGIIVRPTQLITNRKLDARGGIIDYAQVKRDMTNLIKSAKDTEYEVNYFTTMFDLYALPQDFPGYTSHYTDCYNRVDNIEEAFGTDINYYRFIPYIELHEFETLVLCNVAKLQEEYPLAAKPLAKMDEEWQTECNGKVELVNTNWETAPSKRIIKALGDMYSYNKPKMAVAATSAKGIDALRSECPHFNTWLEKLMNL